jgi:serine/threonine protein kinase
MVSNASQPRVKIRDRRYPLPQARAKHRLIPLCTPAAQPLSVPSSLTDSIQVVALKKMRLEGEEDGVPATALREIAILRELRHENIIELQHVFHTDRSLYLAFEYCDSDLKQYMRSIGNKLPPAAVQSYCWQLLNGLAWCHRVGCVSVVLWCVTSHSRRPVLVPSRPCFRDCVFAHAVCPPSRAARAAARATVGVQLSS